MEKIIGSFFLLIILLFLHYKLFNIKKRHFQKSSYFRKKIQKIRSKKKVLDTKFEIDAIEKKEVDDLAKQVVDLHKLILENKIK